MTENEMVAWVERVRREGETFGWEAAHDEKDELLEALVRTLAKEGDGRAKAALRVFELPFDDWVRGERE